MPAINDVSVPVIIGLTAVAPGVVDSVRAQVWVGIVASQISWRGNKLTAAQQSGVGTAAVRAACTSHPFSSRSNADLV